MAQANEAQDLSLPPIPRGGSSGIVGRPPSSSSGGTPSWDGPVTRELLFHSAKSLDQAFKSAGLDIRNLPADMVIPSRWVLLPDGQGTQVRIAQAIEDREYVDGEVLPAPALTLPWRFRERKKYSWLSCQRSFLEGMFTVEISSIVVVSENFK